MPRSGYSLGSMAVAVLRYGVPRMMVSGGLRSEAQGSAAASSYLPH